MSRPLMSVVAMLVCASFVRADDDPAAKELYKKVADGYMAAETVHIKEAKIAARDKDGMNMNMTSDIWLATEGRLSFQVTMDMGGQKMEMRAVSDGKTLATSGGPGAGQGEAPKDLYGKFRGALLAGGVMPSLSIMDDPAAFKDGGTSDFKPLSAGKVGDADVTVIEYTYHFTSGNDDVALGVKIYVDKTSAAILKRESTDPKQGLDITEEYAGFDLGSSAPDGTFDVPEGGGAQPDDGGEEPEPPADEQPR